MIYAFLPDNVFSVGCILKLQTVIQFVWAPCGLKYLEMKIKTHSANFWQIEKSQPSHSDEEK